MKIWDKGDICYFTGVKGFGAGVIQGFIEDIDGSDALVHVPNGYKSPWLKKLSDLFDTEQEAKEMVDLENSEMPSILDIMSVQPMMAPTLGAWNISYKVNNATNSTQSDVNQPSTAGGNGDEDSVSTGKPQEEGNTGGIQGRYKVPPLHL